MEAKTSAAPNVVEEAQASLHNGGRGDKCLDNVVETLLNICAIVSNIFHPLHPAIYCCLDIYIYIYIYIGGLGELVRFIRTPVTGRLASFRLCVGFVRAVRAVRGEAKLCGCMWDVVLIAGPPGCWDRVCSCVRVPCGAFGVSIL